MKPFTKIAVLLLALVAVGHLHRLITGWEMVLAGIVVPSWTSALVVLVWGGAAVMLWREAKR